MKEKDMDALIGKMEGRAVSIFSKYACGYFLGLLIAIFGLIFIFKNLLK